MPGLCTVTCTSSSQPATSNRSTQSHTLLNGQRRSSSKTTTKSQEVRDLKAHCQEASKFWCFSWALPFSTSSLRKNALFSIHLLTLSLDAKPSSMILSSPEKYPYFYLLIIKYPNTVHDTLRKKLQHQFMY